MKSQAAVFFVVDQYRQQQLVQDVVVLLRVQEVWRVLVEARAVGLVVTMHWSPFSGVQ